jgi:hypothetical protein
VFLCVTVCVYVCVCVSVFVRVCVRAQWLRVVNVYADMVRTRYAPSSMLPNGS